MHLLKFAIQMEIVLDHVVLLGVRVSNVLPDRILDVLQFAEAEEAVFGRLGKHKDEPSQVPD